MAVSSPLRCSLFLEPLRSRTRIKICGITRPQDARAAVECGADAIGLVFYPPSRRYVSLDQALAIARSIPPFVAVVGLFVNEERANVGRIVDALPLQLLQFHGDELEADCTGFGLPYIKAARVRPGFDLLEYAALFPSAQGLLLDAFVEGFGGSGKTFDWSLIPQLIPLPLVLSGGLNASNVAAAVKAMRPWAVDCSSGVETAPGIKDERKIAEFISEVRNGEA